MKKKNVKEYDPHNRLGKIIKVLMDNSSGIGMNKLSEITEIPKPTLYKVLDTPEARKLIKCTIPKSRGQKMNIRLQEKALPWGLWKNR